MTQDKRPSEDRRPYETWEHRLNLFGNASGRELEVDQIQLGGRMGETAPLVMMGTLTYVAFTPGSPGA